MRITKSGVGLYLSLMVLQLGFFLCIPAQAQEPDAKQRLILVPADRELNAYDLADGSRVWQFSRPGMIKSSTPAVDQDAGVLYYQTRGYLWKINAANGELIQHVHIRGADPSDGGIAPRDIHTGATVLVNDDHGYYIVCYYGAFKAYNGSLRVYDAELNLVWTVMGLNTGVKTIPAYHDGVVYIGTGETFQGARMHEWYEGRKEDARVIAYNVADGSVKWTCEIDPEAMYRPHANRGVDQVIYCNGYIIGTSQVGGGKDGAFGEYYIIDAENGTLLKKYTHDGRTGACGRNALSYGRHFRGGGRTTAVFQLGTGEKNDFAPYGVNQLNHNVAPDSSLQTLDENITFLGRVKGEVSAGAQGSIVHNGIVYSCGRGTAGGVLAIDAETLDVVREYDSGPIWDSSPMIVENHEGTAVLLVLNHIMEKVRAYDVVTGEHLWDSEGKQIGRYVFGFSYYDRTVEPMDPD